jgi:hypothetical protein
VVRATQEGRGTVADVLLRERTGRLLLRSLLHGRARHRACSSIGVALAWLTVRSDLPGGGCGPSSPRCRWRCRPTSRPSRGSRSCRSSPAASARSSC